MSEFESEVYRQQRTAQDKYTYFLLTAAAAAIALSLQTTSQSALSWSQFPLGLAVALWSASFYFGCRRLNCVSAIITSNLSLLQIEQGTHPGVPPKMKKVASNVLEEGVEKTIAKSSKFATSQFRTLVAGAVSFVVWHIIEMALRIPNDMPV